MTALNGIKKILADVLGLGERATQFTENSYLLGSLAELDSISVVSVIVAIEDRYGIKFDDNDINASVFATVGSLTNFVDQQLLQSKA
jgi:acyl carrier protein